MGIKKCMSWFSLCLLLIFAKADPISAESFASIIGRPLTVSMYQAPSKFSEGLRELDEKDNHISWDDEWRPFLSSDVWIYFLKDIREASELGGGVAEVFKKTYKDDGVVPLSQQIVLTTGENRKIMMLFYFIGNPSGNKTVFLSNVCKSIIAAKSAISGPLTDKTPEPFSEKC
jgi:hypothetical protein